MFYGTAPWDPWLIVAQILCLQCLYYLSLGVFLTFLVGTRVSRMSLVYFFDYAAVTTSTVTGWCVITSFLLSSLAGAGIMLYLIERAKKCLDFSATVYIIHLFICIIYGGWPSSITWWVLNGTGVAVMALLDETQQSVVPIESSSLACNSEVQSSESSPQPNDLGFHDPGIGSSLSATVIPPFASTSLSVPLNVFPGSGFLAPSTFSACDADFGLPPMLSSMLPDQSPLYTHTVGISSPTGVAAGMGSEEVTCEADSVKFSQQAVGSEKTEQLSTVAPLDFGPRISDYVGNLSRTWGEAYLWIVSFCPFIR
ncbi:hypothetical protein CMV_014955 [Castanea mollissima]|uniref:Protein SYS1 homolog n=1 Tax=Castanea mollissima TaxID=60419 RepID=A0A8J4VTX1_9ROSI|nr:hypothetical protein CMV_014955 [Castanea mollissima]